jgi:hypothetical protein
MIDTEKLLYRIVRSRRDPSGKAFSLPDVVELPSVVGITAARAKCDELQREYDAANPDLSTWNKDLFCVELVNGKKINAALQRQRTRRCAQAG